jgi:DNA repair exonuclease SbcCD nuclease subunit
MSQPFTFVHAADLHLDTPFSGVERNVSAELATRLRDATLDAFDRLVELCLQAEATFLVIAGDLCDGPERGIRAQARLRKGLDRLARAGISTFIVAGNHDPLPSQGAGGWSELAQWPERVHFFKSRAETLPVTRDGETLAIVHGISYPNKAVKTDLAAKLKKSPDDAFQVGVVHATLGEANASGGHQPYAPTTIETLVESGLDYWALGHVHTRTVVRESSPTVAYPGNIQALSSRETGARGAYVVRVDEAGAAALEFAPLDSVRFARVELSIADIENASQLIKALEEQLEELRRTGEGRDVVVKFTLTGCGPLNLLLSQEGALGELLATVRENEGGGDPLTWVASIRDRTSPELDIEALRGQSTLPAALLEKAEQLGSGEEALKSFAADAWGELLTARNRKLLTEPDTFELQEELAEARNRALVQLAAGGEEQ